MKRRCSKRTSNYERKGGNVTWRKTISRKMKKMDKTQRYKYILQITFVPQRMKNPGLGCSKPGLRLTSGQPNQWSNLTNLVLSSLSKRKTTTIKTHFYLSSLISLFKHLFDGKWERQILHIPREITLTCTFNTVGGGVQCERWWKGIEGGGGDKRA